MGNPERCRTLSGVANPDRVFGFHFGHDVVNSPIKLPLQVSGLRRLQVQVVYVVQQGIVVALGGLN